MITTETWLRPNISNILPLNYGPGHAIQVKPRGLSAGEVALRFSHALLIEFLPCMNANGIESLWCKSLTRTGILLFAIIVGAVHHNPSRLSTGFE